MNPTKKYFRFMFIQFHTSVEDKTSKIRSVCDRKYIRRSDNTTEIAISKTWPKEHNFLLQNTAGSVFLYYIVE